MGAAHAELSAPSDLLSALPRPFPVASQAPISEGWALVAAPRLALALTAHMSASVALSLALGSAHKLALALLVPLVLGSAHKLELAPVAPTMVPHKLPLALTTVMGYGSPRRLGILRRRRLPIRYADCGPTFPLPPSCDAPNHEAPAPRRPWRRSSPRAAIERHRAAARISDGSRGAGNR
jgi:hypothetical protein